MFRNLDEDGEGSNKLRVSLNEFKQDLNRQVNFRLDAAAFVRHQLRHDLLQPNKKDCKNTKSAVLFSQTQSKRTCRQNVSKTTNEQVYSDVATREPSTEPLRSSDSARLTIDLKNGCKTCNAGGLVVIMIQRFSGKQ